MKCLFVGHGDATEDIINEAITYSGFHVTEILFIRGIGFATVMQNLAHKYHVPYKTFERIEEPIERLVADRKILKDCQCMIIVAHYLTPRMRKLIEFARELNVPKYIYRSNWDEKSKEN